MEFFRQESWKSCPRGSSWYRDLNRISWVSCISRWFLYHSTTWEAPFGSLALLIRPKCREGGDGLRAPSIPAGGRVLGVPSRPCLWIAHPGFLFMLETRLACIQAEAGAPLLGPLLSSHNHDKAMGMAVHITDVSFSKVFPHSGQKAFLKTYIVSHFSYDRICNLLIWHFSPLTLYSSHPDFLPVCLGNGVF